MELAGFDRIVAGAGFVVRHLRAPRLQLAAHSIPAYAVMSVLDGGLHATVRGMEVGLRAGQSLLIDPGASQAFVGVDAEVVSIEMEPEVFDELLVEMGWWRAGTIPAFRTNLADDGVISGLARTLGEEVAVERPGQGTMLEALVRQLAVHLIRTHVRVRHVPDIELSRVGPVDRRLRRAIELMHDRCAEELSLKELAASVFLSEYYFAHLFKEITGLSPHAYLANVRLERARALLIETDTPITDIAAEVGYRSPSHFAHAFREVVGTSPRAFRGAAKRAVKGSSLPQTAPRGESNRSRSAASLRKPQESASQELSASG